MDLRNQLDGYRLEVVRRGLETTLYSRRQNLFNQKLPYIAAALNSLPDDTVIDGEVVAIGPDGRPDFNLVAELSRQHWSSKHVFRILIMRPDTTIPRRFLIRCQ